MCTGNFYCDEISTQAVLTIAEYLDIQPQLVDEVIHSFTAYEMPWDIVAEQNLYPKHPQKLIVNYWQEDSFGSLTVTLVSNQKEINPLLHFLSHVRHEL